MVSTSGDVQYIGGVQYIRVFSTLGGVQYIGDYHEYIGDYHEYIGDYHEYIGDIMSTSRDVQYIGGISLCIY